MKLLIVVLLNYMSSSTRQCGPAVTLFKKEQELPGPSMLFNASLAQGIFEFTFKTFVEDALVLYQDDEGYSDYIELTLQGGRVYLSFYIKNSRKREFYVSNNKYNDYKWHPVKIERNASCTKIFVDYEVKKTFKTNGLQSRFTSKLQIGGFPPERYSDPNTITRQAALTIFAFPFNK